ncbi:MAG: hypothetical protein RID91_11900 [Azospirillaceae bacterium]
MLWIVAGFATPGEALSATRGAAIALVVLVVVHLAAVLGLGAPSPVWPATTAWVGAIAPAPVLAGAAGPAGLLGPASLASSEGVVFAGAAVLVAAFFALAAWALWEAGRVAALVLCVAAIPEIWATVAATRGVLAQSQQPDAALILRIVLVVALTLTAIAALRGSFGADDRLD